jgi:hypothetical protein
VGIISIEQWTDGEKLSPKLAQACVDLLISQIAYPSFPSHQIFKNQLFLIFCRAILKMKP